MKLLAAILLCILFSISSSDSNEEILRKVSNKISSIESVKYDSRLEFWDDGQLLHNDICSFAFDFRTAHTKEAKHYLSSERSEIIYNGKETFQSLVDEKVIIHSDDNNLERVNNPMSMTLKPLIQILPKLIHNKELRITRETDTLINGNQHFSLSFRLENQYIDWINAEIVDGESDSKFFLLINKKSYLPYKIISPNGKNGSISRTFENFNLDYNFPEGLWSGDLLPKDFPIVPEEQYFTDRKNNMMDNFGKMISDFELPLISSNTIVNPSKLNGKIVLLEFWFKGCGPCISAIPSLNDLSTKFKNNDFEMYGIEYLQNQSLESLQKYINEQEIKYPNLYQGKDMAALYGIKGAPTFMVLDKTGKIIFLNSGFSDERIAEITALIDRNI